jgi:hypothetical protein
MAVEIELVDTHSGFGGAQAVDWTPSLDQPKREFGGLLALGRGRPAEGLRLLHRGFLAQGAMWS